MAQPPIKLLFPAGQLMVHLEKGPREGEWATPWGFYFVLGAPSEPWSTFPRCELGMLREAMARLGVESGRQAGEFLSGDQK